MFEWYVYYEDDYCGKVTADNEHEAIQSATTIFQKPTIETYGKFEASHLSVLKVGDV